MLTRRGDNVGVLLYFEALFIEIPVSGWFSFLFCLGETSSGNLWLCYLIVQRACVRLVVGSAFKICIVPTGIQMPTLSPRLANTRFHRCIF
jgi:hypothetical protein